MAETFETMSFLLMSMGAVLVLEGIPYFGFPNKVKEWALVLQEMPEKRLRLLGFAIMATGLLIIYAIKSI